MTRLGALACAALLVGAPGCTSAGERAGDAARPAPPGGGATSDAELLARAGLEPCPEPAAGAPGAAGRLPEAPLPCLGEGPAVAPSALAGAPTVVNLWASWCGPCIEEMPALQAVHGQDGLRVVGVLTQDTPRQGLAAAAGLGVTFPSVVDDRGTVLRALGLKALPATLLVRPDGSVAHTYVGPALDEAAVRRLAAEHLGVPPETS